MADARQPNGRWVRSFRVYRHTSKRLANALLPSRAVVIYQANHEMNTTDFQPRMDTNEHESDTEEVKLILKEEVFQLVGCAMEVLNGIGHGLHEKIYENALVVEFKLRGIAFEQQRRF